MRNPVSVSLLSGLALTAAAVVMASPDPVVYDATPDPRLCPSPYCGGYWIEEVNLTDSICGDGSIAEACYVVDIDLDRLGVGPIAQARIREAIGRRKVLVSGTYEPYPFAGNDTALSILVVDRFWYDPLR